MNQKEEKFVELARYYEELKERLNAVREELDSVMLDLNCDHYVQDPSTLAVYKIYKPQGTFVSFRNLDYKRTSLEGEKGGGSTVLSKKEAQEAGFILTK